MPARERMADESARLAAIRERIGPLRGYLFSCSGPHNAPGRTYRVQGYRPGIDGNPTCPTLRGPEAYFTSADDADAYQNLVADLAWLIAEYERLTESVAANI